MNRHFWSASLLALLTLVVVLIALRNDDGLLEVETAHGPERAHRPSPERSALAAERRATSDERPSEVDPSRSDAPKTIRINVSRDGRPVADWPVRVWPSQKYTIPDEWLRTDASGSLTRDVSGWPGCAIECPGTTSVPSIRLEPGENVADVPLDIAPWMGVIEVVDSLGQPCPDARVVIGPAPYVMERTIELGRTGADGTFESSAVFADHVVAAWHPTAGNSIPRQIEPSAERVRLKVYGGSQVIQGRVTDRRGRPIAGAAVGFGFSSPIREYRMSGPLPRETRSDASGMFVLEGCPRQSGPIWGRADGYAVHHAWFNPDEFALIELRDGCDIIVKAPGKEPIDLTIQRAYTGPGWTSEWPTREGSDIIFYDVEPGSHRLGWGGHEYARELRPIHVDESQETIEVTMIPGGRPLSGRTVTLDGEPAPGIMVRCHTGSGTACSLLSDENGSFSFSSVPPDAKLVASRRGPGWSCDITRPMDVRLAVEEGRQVTLEVDLSEAEATLPDLLLENVSYLELTRSDGIRLRVRVDGLPPPSDRLAGIPPGTYVARASRNGEVVATDVVIAR